MRKYISSIFFVAGVFLLTGLFLTYEKDLIQIFNEKVIKNYTKLVVTKNDYYRNYNYKFVQNTNNYLVSNKDDIYDVIYTGINIGEEKFQFYCKYDYTECEDDIVEIASDRNLLSNINNFTHPYNSFKKIETKLEAFGKVTLIFERNYTEEEIQKLNSEVDRVYNQLFNSNNTIKYNILQLHNYIITKSVYDSDKISGTSNHNSDKATGALFEGFAICSGYTDAMQLFLEKMGLNNYRVASEKHTWNAVEIDGVWYHLDLTWDDPVTVGVPDLNLLEHSFFLISTRELLNFSTGEHNFDQDVYKELKIEG